MTVNIHISSAKASKGVLTMSQFIRMLPSTGFSGAIKDSKKFDST